MGAMLAEVQPRDEEGHHDDPAADPDQAAEEAARDAGR
jgi:hypothetical protein